MAIANLPSKPKPKTSPVDNMKEAKEAESQPLIPGLPDEIAQLCLLHVPYPYQALIRLVSSSWSKAITDPSFTFFKKTLSLSLPYIFVFAFNKTTSRIQWQALDPKSQRWFILPPMPFSKTACPTSFACTSIPRQGLLFVLGGLKSDTQSPMHNTCMYHAMSNQWKIASPMLTARSFFPAGVVNDDKVIAVGGSANALSDSISAVETYDFKTDTWNSVANMNVDLGSYDSAVVGQRMYITEGWTWPFMFSPRGQVYDACSDTWEEMRHGMREGWTGISVVLHDRLFVISEHGDCRMKVYVEDDDTWRYVGGEKFPCEVMKRPFAVSGVDGKVYVVACGLNVAIGKLGQVSKDDEWQVEWEILVAPDGFRDYAPSNCQVLYA